MQMESYDARLLLEQLLGESRVQLQQQGFTVQLLLPQQEVQIEADVMYLEAGARQSLRQHPKVRRPG